MEILQKGSRGICKMPSWWALPLIKKCKFVRFFTVSKLKKISDIEQICQLPFSHKSFADGSVLCWYFLFFLNMHQSGFLTVYVIKFSPFFPSWIKERKWYCFDCCFEKYNKADYISLSFFFSSSCIFCIRVVLLYKRVEEGSGERKFGLEFSQWLWYLSE